MATVETRKRARSSFESTPTGDETLDALNELPQFLDIDALEETTIEGEEKAAKNRKKPEQTEAESKSRKVSFSEKDEKQPEQGYICIVKGCSIKPDRNYEAKTKKDGQEIVLARVKTCYSHNKAFKKPPGAKCITCHNLNEGEMDKNPFCNVCYERTVLAKKVHQLRPKRANEKEPFIMEYDDLKKLSDDPLTWVRKVINESQTISNGAHSENHAPKPAGHQNTRATNKNTHTNKNTSTPTTPTTSTTSTTSTSPPPSSFNNINHNKDHAHANSVNAKSNHNHAPVKKNNTTPPLPNTNNNNNINNINNTSANVNANANININNNHHIPSPSIESKKIFDFTPPLIQSDSKDMEAISLDIGKDMASIYGKLGSFLQSKIKSFEEKEIELQRREAELQKGKAELEEEKKQFAEERHGIAELKDAYSPLEKLMPELKNKEDLHQGTGPASEKIRRLQASLDAATRMIMGARLLFNDHKLIFKEMTDLMERSPEAEALFLARNRGHTDLGVIPSLRLKNEIRTFLQENTSRHMEYVMSNDVSHSDPRVALRGQKGLFAIQAIAKFTFLGIYSGKVWVEDEWLTYLSNRQNVLNAVNFERYSFGYEMRFGNKILLVNAAEKGNDLRYVNDPHIDPMDESQGVVKLGDNVKFEEIIFEGWPYIVAYALRDIAIKEELLGSYKDEYWQTLNAVQIKRDGIKNAGDILANLTSINIQ